MARHPGKCPKCGGRLDYESAVDEKIVCPACQALLSMPGKQKLSDKVDPLLGQTLGEFEIVELLGRGGMGAVYKARQAALNRFVAVKVLPQRLVGNAKFIERFRREARAIAAARHPNIIEVHTIGSDKGHEFIAMEFVDGEPLSALLKREGRLAPDRALELMKQVASALAEAHAVGILHRDIKPANILLDAKGRVKVADFGLAKQEGVDVSVTATGASLGTPLYMPPEVAEGKPADARSDLYSLGATFYQAIAGKPPFDGSTPAELIIKHVNATVPPLQSLSPDCPAPLCRIVHRLLTKAPDHRYSSAEKLLEALDKVDAHTAPSPLSQRERAGVRGDRASAARDAATLTKPPHPSLSRRERGRAPRRKLLLIAGATIALVLVILILALRGPRVAQPPSAVAPPGIGSPKAPAGPDEANAEVLFRNTGICLGKKEWDKAQGYLDRLTKDYGSTAFAAARRTEIAALQRQIDAYVKGTPKATPPKPGTATTPQPPPPKPEPPPDDEARWGPWETLFDGATLNGWRVVDEGRYQGHGNVRVENAEIILDRGTDCTGIAWTKDFPLADYEVEIEAMRVDGSANFCNVHFPVGSGRAVLELSTGGLAPVELRVVEGAPERGGETSKGGVPFENRKWYEVRVRVTSLKVEAWINGSRTVNLSTAGRMFKPVAGHGPVAPFGFSSYCNATGAVRSVRLHRLRPASEAPQAGPWKVYTDWPFDEAEAKRRQEETAKALGVQVEQDVDLGKGVKMTFVLIPAGEFLMGHDDTISAEEMVKTWDGSPEEFKRERPQHRVRISKPFWLGKYEVTQEQWEAVTGDNPSALKGKPQNPVEAVSWNNCQGFAGKLCTQVGKKFRLPTEAEWEYACRVGSAAEFGFGDKVSDLGFYGWSIQNAGGSTQPVGKLKPNAWGLHDMHGNVWEWCEDAFVPYEKTDQQDPNRAGGAAVCVLRGGSYYCFGSIRPLRSASRLPISPAADAPDDGLRVVLLPEPVKPKVQTPPRTGTPQPAETRAAAYAPESDKVWDLFRQRKYAEAETMLAELAERPEFKVNAPLKADAEAAALLKEFWAAVEKGLGEAKGRFISVAGTSGTLEEAKDGIVRIRTAQGKPVEKELTLLATKQALYYFRQSVRVAQPPPAVPEGTQPRAAVPHDNLTVGVFLLADGTFLDDAGKALAAAGEGPSLALYKERLNAQLMAAAEAEAQKDWLLIEEEAAGKLDPAKVARLTKSLADFAKEHGETKFHKGLGEKLAALKTSIDDSLGYTKWPFDEPEAKRRQKATAEALGVKIEQDIEIAKGVKMTFVLIPAGEFLMGSPPTTTPEKLAAAYGAGPNFYEGEFPQRRVKISRPFWIGKYEVTQEQWMAVFPTNPSRFKDKPKNPVEQVDWNEAHAFGKVLSERLGKTFRLPTEAEWEYACRAGTATEFYWGKDAAEIADFGWSKASSTQPVGMKKPNAWSLHDMAGNVWEWCGDWYDKYTTSAQTDPKGAPAGEARVLRGGAWYYYPWALRSALRLWKKPESQDQIGGLRLVRHAEGPR